MFESVSAGGSRLSERYVSWRCGDCEGLVLDQGPYSANPVDSEPGHRERCGRLSRELDAYLAASVSATMAEQVSPRPWLTTSVAGHLV